MITIEQLNKVLEEVSWWDTNFILNPDILDYADLLQEHRNIINKLSLSFWIAELFVAEDESKTLVYIRSNNDKTIHVLQEWLPECKTLKWYVTWLNIMEDKANLIYNK